MLQPEIEIRGAREHNLQNVNVQIPRQQLICLTGVSGSGKSSLAFDTLYAEGQRRYLESLSTYARQFVGQLPKPDVDYISGLSPSISISQKSTSHNPRSTVGTVTEVYDFLRVLFARIGKSYCPKCDVAITAQTRDQILRRIQDAAPDSPILVLAPLARNQKGQYRELFEELRREGFARVRINGHVHRLNQPPTLDRQLRHNIEVVVDRVPDPKTQHERLADAVDLALRFGQGTLMIMPETEEMPEPGAVDERGRPVTNEVDEDEYEEEVRRNPEVLAYYDDEEESFDDEESDDANDETEVSVRESMPGGVPVHEPLIYSLNFACPNCGTSYQAPSPQLLSFNSPQGMCPSCHGIGHLYTFVPERLIPDPTLSIKKGAVTLLGPQTKWNRYLKFQLQGVATTLEEDLKLKKGSLLTTPWCDLPPELAHQWLYGTGDRSIRFTWGTGARATKFAGQFPGFVGILTEQWDAAKGNSNAKQFEKYMETMPCAVCSGERLNAQGRFVRLESKGAAFSDKPMRSLPELCQLSLDQCKSFFDTLVLSKLELQIASELLKEVKARFSFLLEVGLEYLTLGRSAPTLSGGEAQRIRLASQIGSGLVGVLYVLDEPSIGLHPRDNDRLLNSLQRLRNLGNTVVVVEHDEDTMRAADMIIDFGPGPGVRGGRIVAQGSAEDVSKAPESLTGRYLSGADQIEVPEIRRPGNGKSIVVRGAKHNNLKNIDVEIPLGKMVCVTGVSGSGKSSLIGDILTPALRGILHNGEEPVGLHDTIEGIEFLDKMIDIDQSPIGRTPRSNPGTYVKVFDEIRTLFANLPEAKKRGYEPGRFSFNVSGGRCDHCDGNGSIKLEMDFLADVWVNCPVCEGRRYNYETLQVKFKDHSIAEVLDMDIQQALELFSNIPKIAEKLQTLHDVGLDYLKIGQPSPTLSGGEAQRIKLAKELSRRGTGQTLYLLDEPTTGLHFADIRLLLNVLQSLVERGNTVLVIEHNLDVIKTSDWIIDIGPEGGQGGGKLVFAGTPEDLMKCKSSQTGKALRRHLDIAAEQLKPTKKGAEAAAAAKKKKVEVVEIPLQVKGACEHNLRDVNITLPRNAMTVFCGPSGSGKSSLAMDTIYAEGQRRYVESLSSYARQFIGQMPKPHYERIDGLSPAVALEQKNLGHSPRSTVGTVTEIYDYLRILMARLATPYCPTCDVPIGAQKLDEIVERIMSYPEGTRLYLMLPLPGEYRGDLRIVWQGLISKGYSRVRIDGWTCKLEDLVREPRTVQKQVQVVLDRIQINDRSRTRIAESVEAALSMGNGFVQVAEVDERIAEPRWNVATFSQHLGCPKCGTGFDPLTPHSFSFNTARGWCQVCEGIGTQVGTNLAALLDGAKSLRDGAMRLWPGVDKAISLAMLDSINRQTGLPIDKPVDELSMTHKRWLLYGTDDQWFKVMARDLAVDAKSASKIPEETIALQFQYKGIFPALDEAARLNPTLRARLDQFVDTIECTHCGGSRLRADAAAARFYGHSIGDLVRMPLSKFAAVVNGWNHTLNIEQQKIAGEVIRDIQNRIQFLLDVGLEYLTLGRNANTLSGGEAQRIQLARQLGSGLCGVLYVLDEPTIGLHPRDNHRLIGALHRLRDLGNTLLVVEHDRDVIASCDEVCDFGPGSGVNGGNVVAQAAPKELTKKRGSVTGPYINGQKAIAIPQHRRMVVDPSQPHGYQSPHGQWVNVRGARENTLKNIDVDFPLGTLTVVTGPSGSGKSTLINDILHPFLARRLNRQLKRVGAVDKILGVDNIDKVVQVDQSSLGQTPASNPATYTGAFDLIRQAFANTPDAKQRSMSARHFSFNVPGGRCEKCEGNGQLRIEMHFLSDVWVECDSCFGKRYQDEILQVKYRGQYTIFDVLKMSVGEAIEVFAEEPKIVRILQTLADVGLEYVALGQSAPTLSGGEAQRVKLASELARPDTGKTLYLLDEPTTGLHFDDIRKLLNVMQRLVDLGNTVVVIEHNLDVIKCADWMIDLGPDAGVEGGQVVACGPPEAIVAHAAKALAAIQQIEQKTDPKPTAEVVLDVVEVASPKRRKGKSSTVAVAEPPPSTALVNNISVDNDTSPVLLRSFTGEALASILENDPRGDRLSDQAATVIREKRKSKLVESQS